MIYEFDEYGQMERGNENATSICFMIEENHQKTQSDWSAPGFEPGTSRMRVSSVTREPPRSVGRLLYV